MSSDDDLVVPRNRSWGTRIRHGVLGAVGLGVLLPGAYVLFNAQRIVTLVVLGMVIGATIPEVWHRLGRDVQLTQFNLSVPPGSNWAFAVSPDARQVARRMYNQLSTRITARPLADGTGSEKAAISSIKTVCEMIRDHLDEQSSSAASAKSDDVEDLATDMLSTLLTPFLAFWHVRLEAHENGTSSEPWPEAAAFRDDLRLLQTELKPYVAALGTLAGVRDPERIYRQQLRPSPDLRTTTHTPPPQVPPPAQSDSTTGHCLS